MARRTSKESGEQKLMGTWWVRLPLALIFLGLAYGFISVALDSGSLIEYGIAIIFAVWGISLVIRTIRNAFAH